MPPCQNKAKHFSLKTAREHAEHHRRTTRGDRVGVYWCEVHQCYHVGHANKKRRRR